MNTCRVINNATVLFNEEFVFDPWIYGRLYYNSWYPISNYYSKKKLKKIKYCFISHLHEDHCDLETIKYFSKNTIFFIPDLRFNYILKQKILNLGFNKINFIKIGEWQKVSDKYNILPVPPLNGGGAETINLLKKKNKINFSIDSGVILNTKNDNKNHLILSDNTPYNKDLYFKKFSSIKIDICFFPYNGFATDYPLCYDNLTREEKKKISLKKAKSTEKYIVDFVSTLKPKLLVPYSSEFLITHKRKKEFLSINNKEFFSKELYAKRISKITSISAIPLNIENKLDINDDYKTNKDMYFQSKTNELNKVKAISKIKIPKFKFKNKLDDLLYLSVQNYFKRCEKLGINFERIKKIKFIIELDKRKFFLVNYKKKNIEKINSTKSIKFNYLKLITSEKIFKNILEKKMHLDNCIIGCFLSWERKPNIYFKELYFSLNFLHV